MATHEPNWCDGAVSQAPSTWGALVLLEQPSLLPLARMHPQPQTLLYLAALPADRWGHFWVTAGFRPAARQVYWHGQRRTRVLRHYHNQPRADPWPAVWLGGCDDLHPDQCGVRMRYCQAWTWKLHPSGGWPLPGGLRRNRCAAIATKAHRQLAEPESIGQPRDRAISPSSEHHVEFSHSCSAAQWWQQGYLGFRATPRQAGCSTCACAS